jgi:hypothetical protein
VSDHEALEQPGRHTEDTFGWVELPLELSLVGEGFGEVSNELIFLYGLHDHIVYVGFDVLPNLRLQALLNCLLICCSSVFQAKGDDLVAIDAMRCYERRFVFVVGI